MEHRDAFDAIVAANGLDKLADGEQLIDSAEAQALTAETDEIARIERDLCLGRGACVLLRDTDSLAESCGQCIKNPTTEDL